MNFIAFTTLLFENLSCKRSINETI